MEFIYGQYVRDVLWRQCITHRPDVATTYVRLNSWGNRHFFLLLRSLSSAEYPCVVGARRPWIVHPAIYARGMDRYARMAFRLPHAYFSSKPPRDVETQVFVHDGNFPELERLPWRARIRVEYNVSLPPPSHAPWKVMPLLMHPFVYAFGDEERAAQLRSTSRGVRMFFGGNLDESAYSSSRSLTAIQTRFSLLDRPTIIRTLADGLGDQVQWIGCEGDWRTFCKSAVRRPVVFAGLNGFRIPPRQWLETLSKCDVFVAPSGVFFPLCHNLVEAMSVGCIPFTNYPEWHDPPLEHMRNCIAFSTREDLLEKAKMILSMDPPELANMRQEVIRYYETYFNANVFPKQLLERPAKDSTLFVVTDHQRYWKGVTRESVIFAGRQQTRDDAGAELQSFCAPAV